VSTAQARAEAIAEASRREADQVTAELARAREEQAAELDLERATALAGLAEEKSHLEAQIAALRETERQHHSQMRDVLAQHLALLEATSYEPPSAIAG